MNLLNKITAASLLAMSSMSVFAGGISDDPTLTYLKADKLEVRDAKEGKVMVLALDGWIGKDLEKFWVKYSSESLDGSVESSEIDLLYSVGFDGFWDVQYGIRQEIDPNSNTWVGAGFQGLAPYLFDVDANAFINSDGNLNLRLDAEYEYMLTQRWILIPSFEVSFYTQDDVANGIEAGINTAELGLRLQYQIKREISPYVGVNYEDKLGAKDTQLLAGISFWF